jgi:putative integral membrane protein (TIGR02587 family)
LGHTKTQQSRTADHEGPWQKQLIDLTRAASGGLLFGVPLLYTMEIWWIGTHTTPLQVLGVLAVTALPLYLLNQTSGFRSARDVRVRDAAVDTAVGMALALVLVAGVLVVLREITTATPTAEAVAKVVYESLPFCLGIGVANHFLRGGRDARPDDREAEATADDDASLDATVADLGATAIGAVFVALNIAPTDEIPMLTSAMGPGHILVLMAVSLLTSYAIVFVAGFARQDRRHSQVGLFQRPLTETIASYLVALSCAALMLAVFQRLGGPWQLDLRHVAVLGFPAAIGGAAGRLAL